MSQSCCHDNLIICECRPVFTYNQSLYQAVQIAVITLYLYNHSTIPLVLRFNVSCLTLCHQLSQSWLNTKSLHKCPLHLASHVVKAMHHCYILPGKFTQHQCCQNTIHPRNYSTSSRSPTHSFKQPVPLTKKSTKLYSPHQKQCYHKYEESNSYTVYNKFLAALSSQKRKLASSRFIISSSASALWMLKVFTSPENN